MLELEIVKYHGAGNDFILLDRRETPLPGPAKDLAIQLCHRRYGVGGDGVLLVGASETAGCDAAMEIVNSDGSGAEMCGNGLRCVVKHLLDPTPERDEITVETGAGPLACRAERDAAGRVVRVRVDLGRPILARAEIPLSGEGPGVREPLDTADGQTVRFTGVSMGNPHAIVFVEPEQGDEAEGPDPVTLARRLGPGLEIHPRFPSKANISFVRPEGERLRAAVWERGAGLTAACGTGACAIGVAAVLEGRAAPDTAIPVALPGGELEIRVSPGAERVLMTGPAVRVFSATVDPAALTDVSACERLTDLMGL